MGKYSELTKLIEPLKTDSYGEWHFDNEHTGTHDDPIQMPFVTHTKVVHELFDAIIKFKDENPDYDLARYNELLEERGLEWKHSSLVNADVKDMDGQGIMAMLTGLLRGERFCEGSVLSALNDGTVIRWLERLKEIDEEEICIADGDWMSSNNSRFRLDDTES